MSEGKVVATNMLPILPFEVLLENVLDFAQIQTLLALRQTCRAFKDKIDQDLSAKEWSERTSVVAVENPSTVCPQDIHVKSRLSLACIAGQCCMLCGVTKRKKKTYPAYGVYAHEKCLQEQLISSEMLSSQGCMQAWIVRQEYCFHTNINAGRWNSRRIWEMPRWCVRNTMYDLLVTTGKIQQFQSWTESGFQRPVQLKWMQGTAEYRKSLKDKYRRQLETGLRERVLTSQQKRSQENFEQLKMLLGEKNFNSACQLLAELVSLRRKIRRKYGKANDEMPPEQVWSIMKVASNGDLKRQFHFVKYGYARAHFQGEIQSVGNHMSLSKWMDILSSTRVSIRDYSNLCKVRS